jgi:hypothetical protein
VIEGKGFSEVGSISRRGVGVMGVEGDGNLNDKVD